MTPAQGSAGLSRAHLRLAGLLADTDLSAERLAVRFGVSVHALHRHKSRVYGAYGVHSRPGLRAAMLALELAPVDARRPALRAEAGPVVPRIGGLRERPAEREQMTARELQFARAYAVSGLSARELADRHYVSVNTVKTHLRKSFDKLGVQSRAQLRAALVKAARASGGSA